MMATGRYFRILAVGTVAAVLAGGAASAQTASDADSPRMPKTLRILDTNGDNKVTLDEITAEQKRLIGAADLDGDGKLSVDEFRRRGRWFQRLYTTTLFDLMDANGDQALTAEEIAAPSARWFKRYDANADGGIVTEEVPPLQRGKGRYHR
jgi:hypothetical protein